MDTYKQKLGFYAAKREKRAKLYGDGSKYSFADIGKMENPPVTAQTVKMSVDKYKNEHNQTQS
jgi:hypothetical protein